VKGEKWLQDKVKCAIKRLKSTSIESLEETCYNQIKELYLDADSITYYYFRQGPLLDTLNDVQEELSVILTKFIEYIKLMEENPAACKDEDKVLELTLYACMHNHRLCYEMNISNIINLYKNSLCKRIDIKDICQNALRFHNSSIVLKDMQS
jgi:hypothetical protein